MEFASKDASSTRKPQGLKLGSVQSLRELWYNAKWLQLETHVLGLTINFLVHCGLLHWRAMESQVGEA